MVLTKAMFFDSTGSSLAANIFFSMFYWGLVALPQILASTYVGEISILFQEHRVRLGVLNWRGRRQVRGTA